MAIVQFLLKLFLQITMLSLCHFPSAFRSKANALRWVRVKKRLAPLRVPLGYFCTFLCRVFLLLTKNIWLAPAVCGSLRANLIPCRLGFPLLLCL